MYICTYIYIYISYVCIYIYMYTYTHTIFIQLSTIIIYNDTRERQPLHRDRRGTIWHARLHPGRAGHTSCDDRRAIRRTKDQPFIVFHVPHATHHAWYATFARYIISIYIVSTCLHIGTHYTLCMVAPPRAAGPTGRGRRCMPSPRPSPGEHTSCV